MKVVREPPPKPDTTQRKPCWHCHGVWEFDDSNMKYRQKDGRYVACPCCGHWVWCKRRGV